MKKLIAILVVFAVLAGAAFAQDAGTWSIGGSGKLASNIYFLNQVGDKITYEGADYNYTREEKIFRDGYEGSLSVTYERGVIKTVLGFNQAGRIDGTLEVAGDGFNFKAKAENLVGLAFSGGGVNLAALWGNFKIGDLLIQGSYADKEEDRWSVLGDNILAGNKTKDYKAHALIDWDLSEAVQGLSVGFIAPGVFNADGAVLSTSGTPSISQQGTSLTNNLWRTIFGVKYAEGDLSLALQFSSLSGLGGTYGGEYFLRAQAKYQIMDPLWAGLDFVGVFTPDVGIDFGVKVNYEDGPLAANARFVLHNGADTKVDLKANVKYTYEADPLAAWFGITYEVANISDTNAGKIDIEPGVRYDITPDFLRFNLDTKFTIPFAENAAIGYEFKPSLKYNFLGTGLGDGFGDLGMALYLEYTIGGNSNAGLTTNRLYTGLKWKF